MARAEVIDVHCDGTCTVLEVTMGPAAAVTTAFPGPTAKRLELASRPCDAATVVSCPVWNGVSNATTFGSLDVNVTPADAISGLPLAAVAVHPSVHEVNGARTLGMGPDPVFVAHVTARLAGAATVSVTPSNVVPSLWTSVNVDVPAASAETSMVSDGVSLAWHESPGPEVVQEEPSCEFSQHVRVTTPGDTT